MDTECTLRARSGLEPSITVLAAIVLLLMAGAFLLFIVSTGMSDATDSVRDTVDEVTSEIQQQAQQLRTTLVNALQTPFNGDDPDDEEQETAAEDTSNGGTAEDEELDARMTDPDDDRTDSPDVGNRSTEQ